MVVKRLLAYVVGISLLMLPSGTLHTGAANPNPPESQDELTRVIAEGAGQTFESARQDAWRNAVTQVVGALGGYYDADGWHWKHRKLVHEDSDSGSFVD